MRPSLYAWHGDRQPPRKATTPNIPLRLTTGCYGHTIAFFQPIHLKQK